MTERVESLWQWWPFVAYIACIVGANWAVATFGPVPVGFGLVAPAGVFFAGLTFTFLISDDQRLRHTNSAAGSVNLPPSHDASVGPGSHGRTSGASPA